MADSASVAATIQAVAAAAAAASHRRLVVIAGERQWGQEQAKAAIAALPGAWCWVGDGSDALVHQVEVDRANTLLGAEWQGAVYDAHAGFDPDAFGAVAGTLQAGGLLLLLTPPLAEWPDFPDPQRRRITVYPYAEEQLAGRFLRRLAGLLQGSGLCYRIEQGKPLPPLPRVIERIPSAVANFAECATADQHSAVEVLCRVAKGHRRRPLVLVSDRGRGKSAALGLAAARLLREGGRRIVVTAPRLAAVAPLFRHAAAQLPGAELARGRLTLPDGGELLFEPPDRVVHEAISCELLLVDEAAAIPVSLLQPMLQRHARIAFATTVHGYEGTGRGFELRFRKVLDELTPQWRRLRLQQPIRWAEGDPLEQLVFRALLLDAEPAADEQVKGISLDACRVERLDRDTLLEDEALLSQLFGLLVLAHYRTTPSDLRNLLDGPNLELSVLRHQGTVVGCALVAREGGFDAALSRQVYTSERRLRGNLLPQALASHAGLAEAPQLLAARVMRIAVHPARQGEGFGRHLVGMLAARLAEEGRDYLGASFGGDAPLLDFWRHCGCEPVHVGMQREASSGAHAMMVMVPLSAGGERLYQQARARLARQLPALLTEPLAGLEAELVARLLKHCAVEPPDEMAWRESCAFALAQRDYGNALPALERCLLFALSVADGVLSEGQQAIAICKVLQRQPWPVVAERYGLAGRKEGTAALREAFQHLCRHYG